MMQDFDRSYGVYVQVQPTGVTCIEEELVCVAPSRDKALLEVVERFGRQAGSNVIIRPMPRRHELST